MPEGKSIIVIWFHILCLAGKINDGGFVYFTKDIPFTDEMLAVEFDEDLKVIRLALETFKQFRMLEIVEDFLMVSNWERYQSADKLKKIREKTRLRVAKHREKQKQITMEKDSNVTVTLRNAIDKDKDKEEDKNNNIDQQVDRSDPSVIDFDAEFDALWKIYPRKVGKAKALQHYKKYRKTKNSSFEDVKEGIEKFNKYIKLNNIDVKFIPHGSTWFNQKRWDDELDLSKSIRFNKNKKVNPLPDWYDDYQKELKKQTNKKPKAKSNEGDIKKVKEMLGG